MATGRERRAERLNERLRGAQRTNVEVDETFELNIPELRQATTEAPSGSRQTPNTSAKRRKFDSDGTSAATQKGPSDGQRSAAKGPFDLPDSSKELVGPAATRASATRRDTTALHRFAEAPLALDADEEPDALESLTSSVTHSSPVRQRRSTVLVNEVAESPANAPGSGQRRRVRQLDELSSSARLQAVTSSERDSEIVSSPLARKQRRGGAASSNLSSRTTRAASRIIQAEAEVRGSDQRREDYTGNETEHDGSENADAEQLSDREAARVLGKRPRRNASDQSPDLGSGELDLGRSAHKRTRIPPPKSPAVQRQPAVRREQQRKPQISKAKAKTRRQPRQKKMMSDQDSPKQQRSLPVDIIVQRLVNINQREDGEDANHRPSSIPFANYAGENVIDVLAQICDEVTGYTIYQYEELLGRTDDATRKSECIVKKRAVEAYREELGSRLLQHTIHLNYLHSLRKRVRTVQREKLALREEIIRLRAEREQVALRMDAIRTKHQADTKAATARLDLSSLMYDIELAVGRGQESQELSPAEQKRAELANLELLIAQVSDEASSSSAFGGLLGHIKDFNAFLERAAIALETG